MSDPVAKYETRESVNGQSAIRSSGQVEVNREMRSRLDGMLAELRPTGPMTDGVPVEPQYVGMRKWVTREEAEEMFGNMDDVKGTDDEPVETPSLRPDKRRMQEFYEEVGKRRAELAREINEEYENQMHVPYTGKRYVPEYYMPQCRNPRIDKSADASDVSHAFGLKDPRVANVVERLLRAGKKPGESYLKDLHKAAEDLHRAIEFAEMEQEGE